MPADEGSVGFTNLAHIRSAKKWHECAEAHIDKVHFDESVECPTKGGLLEGEQEELVDDMRKDLQALDAQSEKARQHARVLALPRDSRIARCRYLLPLDAAPSVVIWRRVLKGNRTNFLENLRLLKQG